MAGPPPSSRRCHEDLFHGAYVDSTEKTAPSRAGIKHPVSLKQPLEIKEGMVFALATHCPAIDGMSAARIEKPTPIPVGKEDGATPPPLAHALAARRPDATVIERPGAGRGRHIEPPDRLVRPSHPPFLGLGAPAR